MKVFTDAEARQNLSEVLNIALNEEVEIRRKDGTVFSLKSKNTIIKSPFDSPGIQTNLTSQDILGAVRKSRMG